MPTSRKTTTSRSADFLARAIEFSGRTQREIAADAGFPRPNVISMMKRGDMPIPLERAPALARACRVDPAYFLRLILEEHHPEAYAVLVNTLGEPLSRNEWEMVLLYRLASEDEEIEIDADVAHAVLDALLGFKTGPKAGH